MLENIINHLGWVAVAICAIVILLSLRDVSRFSLTRAWAISGVCFAESIRRKVLWIAPLAMLAVVIVGKFVNPVDQLDNIRQLTMYCVFASALVVTIAALILACTNLPKEIENRVIFTIVTKPTTRLEIVVGKVIGFARVSGTILIIMGLFTYLFLSVKAGQLEADARATETDPSKTVSQQATAKHYADEGLLHAQRFVPPEAIDMYANVPASEADGKRWVIGGIEQGISVPFDVTPELRAKLQAIADEPDHKPDATDLYIETAVATRRQNLTPEQWDQNPEAKEMATAQAKEKYTVELPKVGDVHIPWPLPKEGLQLGLLTPVVSLEVMDDISETTIGGWGAAAPGGYTVQLLPQQKVEPIVFPQEAARAVINDHLKRFTVVIWARGAGTLYGAKEQPQSPEDCAATLVDSTGKLEFAPKSVDGKWLKPNFRGRTSQYGSQLRGGDAAWSPIAAAHFVNAQYTPSSTGNVPFVLRVKVEGGGTEVEDKQSTTLMVSLINHARQDEEIPITEIRPDTRVAAFFDIPREKLDGGDFAIMIRCPNNHNWIALPPGSLLMVSHDDSFAFNLLKSLLVLWLMSVLVIATSIFSSTFLSWPIAVVLTLVLLLGHWGVVQLGDSGGQINSNNGARVVDDMFPKDSAPVVVTTAKTMIDDLTSMLNLLSRILPDLSQFSAMEAIQRGVSMPASTLLDSLAIVAGFGIPLTLLAYVILKNKEVAP